MAAPDAEGYYSHPALHGAQLAFVCEDEAWTVDAAGGVPRRLTAAGGAVSHLRFSPDGAQLAFTVAEAGYEEARRAAHSASAALQQRCDSDCCAHGALTAAIPRFRPRRCTCAPRRAAPPRG